MVTQVTKFITEDGKEFNTLMEAEIHEKTAPIIQKLGNVFDRNGKSTDREWCSRYVVLDDGDMPIISTGDLGKFLLSNLEPIKKALGLIGADEVKRLTDAAYAQGKLAASEDELE